MASLPLSSISHSTKYPISFPTNKKEKTTKEKRPSQGKFNKTLFNFASLAALHMVTYCRTSYASLAPSSPTDFFDRYSKNGIISISSLSCMSSINGTHSIPLLGWNWKLTAELSIITTES